MSSFTKKLFRKIKNLTKTVFVINNWLTFWFDDIGLYKKATRYCLRNGILVDLVTREKNDLTTDLLMDIFVEKDYGDFGNNLTIVDIGANIGAFSMHAVYGRNNMCYAFEPEVKNFEKLQENIKLNGLQEKIKAYNYAVSGDNEDKKLYKFESIAHSLNRQGDNFEIVHCIDMKSIFENNNISEVDFLKIDCEGAEFDILYNTSREIFDKIKCMFLEYHNYSNEEGYDGNSLLLYLEANGFKIKEHKLVQNGVLGIVKAVR